MREQVYNVMGQLLGFPHSTFEVRDIKCETKEKVNAAVMTGS